MRTCTILGAGLSVCVLAGCDPRTPSPNSATDGPRAARAPDSPPTPEQQSIRAAVEAAGVRLPPLRCLFRGRNGGGIHAFPIDRRKALPMWERLRAATEQTGFYPVIIADGEWLIDAEAPDPAETLAAAAEYVDPATWFRKQRELEPDLDEHLERGEWTDDAPTDGYYLLTDHTGIGAPNLAIALVPTTRPWEVVAHIGFGGWNECPNPEVHVAVHRYWHDRYGAEIVAIAGDVIEMRVARPPHTREEAETLAMEQFHYTAGDLVYQGTQTLLALASTLKDGKTWFFWWD